MQAMSVSYTHTNFSQILSAANYLNGASQTKWASAKELDEKHGKDAGSCV